MQVVNASTGPCEVLAPARQTAPLVFASPHSGRLYPAPFVAASRLDALSLRRSEDAFVDDLFAAAPALGAPLLRAHFPRAYVDANREPFELDPVMFEDALPPWVNTASPAIADGFGTVARLITGGGEIYGGKLSFDDVRRRIKAHHVPYHRSLTDLIGATRRRFGACLVIDCHSMPSRNGPLSIDPRLARVDVVLGDNKGRSSAGAVTDRVEATLRHLGFAVRRNHPYSGGFTTRQYGKPEDGIHVLQIEVNRRLYMDENTITPTAGMAPLKRRMERFIGILATLDAASLRAP